MHSDQLITTNGQMFTVHRPDVLTSSVLLSQAGKGNDYSSAPPSRISSVFSFFLHLIPPHFLRLLSGLWKNNLHLPIFQEGHIWSLKVRNGRGGGPRNVRPRDPFTLLETIRDPKPMDMWVIAINIYCIRNSSRDVCKAQEDTSAHAFGHHGDAAACHGSHRRATLQAGRLRVRANTVLTSDPQEGCASPSPRGPGPDTENFWAMGRGGVPSFLQETEDMWPNPDIISCPRCRQRERPQE